MDACDPGLDISNLRTLIKQNTGTELKLSKEQICDIYASIQGGNLPLPPLILSKDGSYLTDRKSPLTRKDFSILFNSTSKVADLRKIAKKVGVLRHADKKLTKLQLTDIIGRRLHSMKVHEPIKLRAAQKAAILKNKNNAGVVNNFNVNNTGVNANNGLGGNVNNSLGGNVNNGLGGNVNNGSRVNVNNGPRVNVNNGSRVNVNNGSRVNVNNGSRVNVNNGSRVNVNNGSRVNVNNGLGGTNFNKGNKKPAFLQGSRNNTSNGVKPVKRTFSKTKKPSFLNKIYVPSSKTIKSTGVTPSGPVQGPPSGPVQGPPSRPAEPPQNVVVRNAQLKENEILLRSYLNRENVSKYINNTQKTNAYNKIRKGVNFNSVQKYINGIISTKISNEEAEQRRKMKIEYNRNELQKILAELTNLSNTNKNEIISKFNSNSNLNSAKSLAMQKDRNAKKVKVEELKTSFLNFLKNKNVDNKNSYVNRLEMGENITTLKREVLDVVNKKSFQRKKYEVELKQLSTLLNSSKNLNNSMKAKFLRNFEKSKDFNKVRKNVEDEFKKINEQRKQGELSFREANQKKLLIKILKNSKNFTNDDRKAFMKRLEAGDNFNTLKEDAIQMARNLAKKRKNRIQEQKNIAEKELAFEKREQEKKLLNKIMSNSKFLNNTEKNVFRQRFNNGEKFNILKENVIKRASNLKKEYRKKEQEMIENEERKRIKSDQRKLLNKIMNNSKLFNNSEKNAFRQRFNKGDNFNIIKTNVIKKAQNLKREYKQKEQEMREEEEKKRIRNEQKRLLNKIMSNSKYLNNSDKNGFRKRFNNGESFNVVKTNVIKKAGNLKREYMKKEQELREEEEKKRIRNEQKRLLNKIMGNSRNLNNTDILEFRQRFNNGENFNVIKANVIKKAQALKQNRLRKKEEEKRIVRDKQKQMLLKILNNSKNFTNVNKNMFIKQFNNGGNFNAVKSSAISKAQELAKVRKNKEEANRLAREKEEENRLKKEEENRIAKERVQQKKKLLKILENSKNFTNANKNTYMRQFNNGGNFNTIKSNAISKAQELAKARKNKEEANRIAREEYEEEQRKAKEEEERKAKEEANRIKREKEREVKRARLTKILRNSKNFTNENRQEFLNRFENGENVNTIKANAISRAKELAKVRKNKEEQNRLEREKEEANRIAKEREEQRLANEEKKKKEEERKARELREKQQKLLSKILNNSKNMTNADKVAFLKRFENGGNFNTVKSNAISRAKELAKVRKNKEEANRLAKEKEEANRKAKEEANRKAKEEANRKAKEREKQQKLLSKILNNSKNLTNVNKVTFLKRFANGGNFNTIKSNAISKAQELAKQRKAKEEANRIAREKEEANRKAKEEANRKAKEREKKQQLLSKILNNSKNLTNTNKAAFLKRFANGGEFNKIKSNAISKAQELAKQRKAKEEADRKAREKEEANRKAKEEMIEKKKAEALAKKKKEEEEKKKKEAENKKKAAQNQQMRASLTKKVKSTQMNQKVKNKLLNQLKNYSIQIKNIAPSIEKTIESEKLNGNYNEAANRKKRQEVKKQLAEYISKTYPNMSKADRKEYINRANLTQWKKGIFSGSQGMEANRAFERIKGNIERNIKSKEKNQQKKNTKANLKKLVNNTMKGRAAKNVNRLKKNINEGISEMTVKTRLAQLNKQTKYQK